MRVFKFIIPLAAGALISMGSAMAQEVLVTSSGQSLDAFTVRTVLNRSGVANVYEPLAMADALEGKQVLIIAVGASIKGFGAAGITAEHELTRTRELVEAAKAQGIRIIAVHIGGAERRGGQSEQFIQMVVENADALVVSGEGNEDGYFTNAAETQGIPIEVVDQPAQVGAVLAGLID